jgi:tungstate transport system permease protein
VTDILGLAFGMILTLEPEFLGIIRLSLRVSFSAAMIAFFIGLPLAGALALTEFAGRRALLVIINALQGLPPVVVGLTVYLLLSRAGPLGPAGLLFTPEGMILAQTILALPIVSALTQRQFEAQWRDVGDQLRIDGAPFLVALRVMVAMSRPMLATIFLTAFGRVIAEVGAIMIVGGNIRGVTRTMTTAIALETSKGELPLALALGVVLVGIVLLIGALVLLIGRKDARA